MSAIFSIAASRGVALAIAAGLSMAAPLQARDTNAIEEANRQRVEASFNAWADGTGSPYDLLADDVVWTITGNSLASRAYPTREEFMSEVIRPFNARMAAPLVPKVRKLYADNETVVAFFDASGTAKDGIAYSNTYAWILEFEDGKIVRANAFFDSIAFDDLWRRVNPDPTSK